MAESPDKRLEKQYTGKRIAQRQEQLYELAQGLLAASGADQTELRIIETDSALTRFAGSSIDEDRLERDAAATVTARLGQREGRAVTNLLSKEGLAAALEQALAAAQASPENPYLADLPDGPREYPFQVDFHEATAACTPEDRARHVIAGFKACQLPEFSASGYLSTAAQNVLVANSRGIEVCFSTTLAKYSVLWTGPDSSGYSESVSRDVAELTPAETAVKGLAVARRSAGPRSDIEAGQYTVILGPECIAVMLGFLSGLAFGGKSYIEGSSAFSGMLNHAVCGANVTISEDPYDPRLLAWPCDMSGLPRQQLALIEGGVARGVAHDLDSAKRAGTASTGHANEMRSPVPSALVFAAGPDGREQLIKDTQRAIYVSRFGDCTVLDPQATLIGGTTRDGTFLIENGELAGGITNFQFTQSILQALGAVSGIADEQVAASLEQSGGYCLVPEAIRVEGFNFSGKSDH